MIPTSGGIALVVQLLDASAELLAVKDCHGRFIAATRAFASALHIDRERLKGRSNLDVFGDVAAADLTACERLAILTGEAVERQVAIVSGGGPERLTVVCTPCYEAGVCTAVLLTCTSEAADGEASPERLRSFASNVGTLAHRFNNALTTVMGLADWHLVAESHEAPLRSDLEKIRAAALTAEQTAREIQRLSRDTVAQVITPTGHSISSSPLASVSSAAAPSPRPTRPVLLVDDQLDVRNSLSVMVRTLGYGVHAAESAAAALGWLETHEASLVLTDFGMPEMDGQIFAGVLQQRWPSLPVVLLTGWDCATERPAGVRTVLPKPLRMAQLRECLKSLVGPPTV
jgi:CheY-like chemotaxis protein